MECQNSVVSHALVQRLVTFNTYFYGFLVLDRLSFFGEPPSTTESWLMALVLGLAVTLLSPLVARVLPHRASDVAARPVHVEIDRVTRDAMGPDLGL